MKLVTTIAICLLLCISCTTTKNKTPMITAPPIANGSTNFTTAIGENEAPYQAGKQVAQELKQKLNGKTPHVIILAECFEEQKQKAKVLKAVASVFPETNIVGGAVYGMFTQKGSYDTDAVALLAISGTGVQVKTALVEKMGAAGLSLETQKQKLVTALTTAGTALVKQIPNAKKSSLIILLADAHSPKNQYLLDGVQQITGQKVAITGGSICKNAGQTFVYYRGAMYKDSAIAVSITTDLKVVQAGRKAKSNDLVISTASEGATTAISQLRAEPQALIVFDCAGRKGKLTNLPDELNAIKDSVGNNLPIFGTYCAGEFGPTDHPTRTNPTPYGKGWHVMFSVFGK